MLITFPLYLVIEVLSLLGTVYSGRGKVRRLISHIGENASKAYISTYRLALKFKKLTAVGFEPTQLAPVELESTPLDHSGKLS